MNTRTILFGCVALAITACADTSSPGNADKNGQGNPLGLTKDTVAASVTGAKASDTPAPDNAKSYADAERELAARDTAIRASIAGSGKAKNVILFVGDGMGVTTVTAARILDGQRKGGFGEENILSFERFPFVGLSKTYNNDAQTPDSAGTMSAMMTGVKTNISMFGMGPSAKIGQCAGSKEAELPSALELAEVAGMATGVVTTARLTHATPGATYARTPSRDWEDDSEIPPEEAALGCIDIASQFLTFEKTLEERHGVDVNGMDVALGGGLRHFITDGGEREDGRDLTAEWQAQYPNGIYADNKAKFLDAESTPLLGLFNQSHMRYEANRHESNTGEPSLAEMTEKAIDLLGNDPDGFFLVVEAGRIDHAHHATNASGALTDTIALSEAVAKADEITSDEDTLIIVTADHSHVMTMAGYPKRGNPILGFVREVGTDEPKLAMDKLPYTTLSYANGLGMKDMGEETNSDVIYKTINAATAKPGRQDLSKINPEAPGFHQEVLVRTRGETHGGEDVAIYASGPGGHLVTGTLEQNMIYHVMNKAADLTKKAEQAKASAR